MLKNSDIFLNFLTCFDHPPTHHGVINLLVCIPLADDKKLEIILSNEGGRCSIIDELGETIIIIIIIIIIIVKQFAG